jgi:hypothetical protein
LPHNGDVSVSLCVFCRQRQVDVRWRPFCSERCRLLDLARWADGDYRISGDPVEEPVDDDASDEQ